MLYDDEMGCLVEKNMKTWSLTKKDVWNKWNKTIMEGQLANPGTHGKCHLNDVHVCNKDFMYRERYTFLEMVFSAHIKSSILGRIKLFSSKN